MGLLGHAVETVLEAQPVPVQGRIDITEVGRLNRDLAVLVHVKGRAGNRAVVAEHPHLGVADVLADRLDLDLVGRAVTKSNDFGPLGLIQPFCVGAEVDFVMRVHCSPSLGLNVDATASMVSERVIADPSKQCRGPRVLPGHPEEIQAGRFGHASDMLNLAALVLDLGDVDPRVVDPESGGPDDPVVVG